MGALAQESYTMVCEDCAAEHTYLRTRGKKRRFCADCAKERQKARSRVGYVKAAPPEEDTLLKIAKLVTSYRLAIEEATSALLLHRYEDARAALLRVESPVRSGEVQIGGRLGTSGIRK